MISCLSRLCHTPEPGGWIAVTLYRRNLVLAWFAPAPSRITDARWTRLHRAVAAFAPPLAAD
jgi:hypothetical protein